MKDEYLIPPIVKDLGDHLLIARSANERANYYQRLDAIRRYCEEIIAKYENSLNK